MARPRHQRKHKCVGPGPAAVACAICAACSAPTNGDTRQAISRGFAFDVFCRQHANPRASASNPTLFSHGGPSPRRPPRHPSLAPPASSPPKGGGEAGLAVPCHAFWSCFTRARAASIAVAKLGFRVEVPFWSMWITHSYFSLSSCDTVPGREVYARWACRRRMLSPCRSTALLKEMRES